MKYTDINKVANHDPKNGPLKAIVFGEISMDILIKVSEGASEGPVTRGSHYTCSFGGRGANQAMAVSRLGVTTYLVGCVGNDDFGKALIKYLSATEVKTEGIRIRQGSSALAILAVKEDGEFRVLSFVEGVNSAVDGEDVERFIHLMNGSCVALFQLGYSVSVISAAAKAAKANGILTILDPAPILSDIADLYSSIDIITPNQQEAETLVGFRVHDPRTSSKAADILHRLGVRTVIIKLGEQGAFCSTPNERVFLPAFKVKAVDTVGAGDAFNGALASGLAYGLSITEAAIWGSAAGAISVTKVGAQCGMPDLKSLMAFIDTVPESSIRKPYYE
jgi:ribokinase